MSTYRLQSGLDSFYSGPEFRRGGSIDSDNGRFEKNVISLSACSKMVSQVLKEGSPPSLPTYMYNKLVLKYDI